ncbi:hypothetical protein ABZ840_12300 [Streptomyces sp. NPDC047117]|uniref:hypothetical protein n=1 Tax=Streptomyces sp. NPDC047117 TaxID=3155379 RepID=UPI0033E1E5F1
MATSTASTAHGYALLIAADPPVRRALPATTVLPQLAAVPPAHLVGAAYASAVQLANPDDPNTVLTHIRTAAGVEGPLFIYLAGHLQVDARQSRPHLALARTAPRTVRYTALPWHWLAAELQHRAPGSTTVVADLAAAPEVWQQLGAGQLSLGGPFLLYGTVQRTDKRSRPQPAYTQALAQALRAAHQRPGTEELHAHVARTAALDGAATLWLGGVPAADGAPGGWPAAARYDAPVAGYGAPSAAQYDAPVAEYGAQHGAPRAEYGGPVPEYDAPGLEYSAPVLAYGAAAPEPGPAAGAAAEPEPTPEAVYEADVAADVAHEAAETTAAAPEPASASEPDDYELAPAAPPASPGATPPEASELPEAASSETPEVQLSKAPEAAPHEAPEAQRSESPEGTAPAATPVPLPPMPARPPIPVVAAIPPVPGAAPVEEPHHAVFAAAAAGRHGEAAAMAAAWEQAALRSHGPVSPEAVHWIEVQAELARQAEEPARASGLWMRSAHVRLAGGQNATDPEVTAAVDRAHHCWHQVSDRDGIRDLGVELANLRGRVPGKSGALDDVQRRLAQLTETVHR